MCTICKNYLPKTTEYFSTRSDKKSLVYQSSCKSCHKEYRKKHYENNKKKYIHKAKKYTDSVVIWFKEFKKTLSCEYCGDERWWVLDFHHKDPLTKDSSIARLMNKGSKIGILKEIEKCIVLCSNCHRDLHHKERLKSMKQQLTRP